MFGDSEGDQVGQGLVQNVFIVSYRETRKLLGIRQNLDQFVDLSPWLDIVSELLDGLVAQIVERSEISKGGRRQALGFFVIFNTFCSDKFVDGFLNQGIQVVVDHLGDIVHDIVLQSVEGWVLRQTTEEVCPSEVVNAVLELLEGSTGDFSIQVIGELIRQAALYWERLIEELLVEVFLFLSDHHTSNTAVIHTRSTAPTNHLQKIGQREVDISLDTRVIILSSFDNDESCREVNTPGQRTRGHEHLNLLFDEQFLHNLPITFSEAGMVHSYAKLDGVSQVFVFDEFT